jgi:hypothetical protein
MPDQDELIYPLAVSPPGRAISTEMVILGSMSTNGG